MSNLVIADFVKLPFNKQVHLCCLKWCKNNHIAPYNAKHKITSDYFKVRAYLMKLPTQTIKNICIMLYEEECQSSIYDLEKLSKKYVREKQSAVEKEKTKGIKREYDIDLEAFLNA